MSSLILGLCLRESGADGEKMKKLYEASVMLYVVAESESEARVIAATEAEPEIHEWKVYEPNAVDAEWWDCLPWGNHNNERTCGEWLKQRIPAPPPSPQPQMIWAMDD